MNSDRDAIQSDIDEAGYCLIRGVLDGRQCRELISLYDEPRLFRKKIVMEAHAYGAGEYQYFRYPLPDPIQDLRTEWYGLLAPIANEWNERLSIPARYPAAHDEYLAVCHEAGQERPTPLLLKYKADDFNRLHQDVYGQPIFPMQV